MSSTVPTAAARLTAPISTRVQLGAPSLLLALGCIPVLIHWPSLIGFLSENPAWFLSGMVANGTQAHGLLAGYPGWIDGNAGVATQALGGLAARDWLGFIVPWWNPSSGVGLPLAAEMQNSAFFLPFVLLLRLFDGVIYLKIALQIVAGLASWALLRELRLARWAAFAGALLAELNGSFAWFGHGPIMPIAFLPLLLFGIERARTHRWHGAFWVGIAIAWSIAAGFPETAYLDGLLGLAWWLYRAAADKAGRPGWAGWIVAGGVAGLLLVAPPMLAFIEALPLSFLGGHLDFSGAGFRAGNPAMLLFPYVAGGLMYGGLLLHQQFGLWYNAAGYLNFSLLLLALVGAVPAFRRGGRERGLRILLALWLVLALGRGLRLPGVTEIVNLIPLVRHTMFHLYVIPSCQMAAIILAALAIDDWIRGERWRPAPWVALAICILLGGVALGAAWPDITLLARAIPTYPGYPILSVLGGLAIGVALSLLLAGPAARWRILLLVGLLGTEAAILFSVPLFAGARTQPRIDSAALDFLAANIGTGRVYGLAALTPNYGALFGIAQINHNYLPVPQNWVDHVRAGDMPGMDGVNFFIQDTGPDAVARAQAAVPALAADGVRYMITRADIDLTADQVGPEVSGQGARAVPLAGGQSLAGTVTASRLHPGAVDRLAVQIGTYRGGARGQLRVRLCSADRCTEGAASLTSATDNAELPIGFSQPLALSGHDDLRYEFSESVPAGASPGAIWLWPQNGPAAESAILPGVPPGLAPRLGLIYAAPLPSLRKVFSDTALAIYKVRNPAAYFDAGDACHLRPVSPVALHAECAAPARLRRLELFFPGWAATRNGQAVAVTATGIFQSIDLPQGASDVRFRYAPPHVAASWLCSALGCLGLLWLCFAGARSSGRRARIGRSNQRLSP